MCPSNASGLNSRPRAAGDAGAAAASSGDVATSMTGAGVPRCVISTRITVYHNDTVRLPGNSTIHHVGTYSGHWQLIG